MCVGGSGVGSGNTVCPPLGPILLALTAPVGSLPQEDGIVESGCRELAVGSRPAVVDVAAEGLSSSSSYRGQRAAGVEGGCWGCTTAAAAGV
jgi:hypothetical protein